MDKLKTKRLPRPTRIVVNWGLPLLLAVSIVYFVNANVRAATPPTTSQLTTYLATSELPVGSANNGGYEQVYYGFGGERFYITSDLVNHGSVKASKQYITWQAEAGNGMQIYLYNVLTGTLTTLTSSGVNEGPELYLNKVVWRKWMGNRYNIFYYNGTTVTNITNNASNSPVATINATQVVYSTQVSTAAWNVHAYNTTSLATTTLLTSTTSKNAYPKYYSSGLRYGL